MRKRELSCILSILFSLLFIIPAFADGPENLIIPQSNPIYEDFFQMAQTGLIKSVPAEQFRYSPMSEYDAAGYAAEAAVMYAQAGGPAGQGAGYAAKLKQYYDVYRKKAFEIYGKTKEMREQLIKVEELLKSPDIKSFDEILDEAKSTIVDIEEEFGKTTYRGVPPFKVMGMLTARWQDVESWGVSRVHQTSLGGTFMQLWTEGIVSSDVAFKLNLTFEKPADEAAKGDFPEYWGTGQRFLDKYTINLTLYGWMINTGFFWEDITPFIAKGTLSDRPALFDRDPYALEETTKGHFENAFLHSFVKRGDIWSKHGFMGVEFANINLPLGGRTKIMAGKAEQFDERYDKLYLYEYAGRYTQPFDISILNNSEISLNFFNRSNEKAEIETLAPNSPGPNYPPKPDGYIQSETIGGGDFKLNILSFLSLSSELEIADFFGYLPKPYDQYPLDMPPKFHQAGNAFYFEGMFKNILPVVLSARYTAIDPGYVCPASAIIDTNSRTVNSTSTGVIIGHDSYAGDPTLLYNNSQRLDLRASVQLPAALGFANFSYGSAAQVTATSNYIFCDHFTFGNRLTGPMWWHLFFSQYGYPVGGRDQGYYNYNAPDHPAIFGQGLGLRYVWTDKWLTNKERIFSTYGADAFGNTASPSIKYTANAGLELKLSLHKGLNALGINCNNLFLDLYGEMNTLSPGRDVMPTFSPDSMFSQELFYGFIVYNLTRKTSLMVEAAAERWSTKYSRITYAINTSTSPYTYYTHDLPIDYLDTSYGVGFDYDFAPRTSIFLRVKRFFHTDNGGSFVGIDPASGFTTTKTYNSSSQNFDGWYMEMEFKNFF